MDKIPIISDIEYERNMSERFDKVREIAKRVHFGKPNSEEEYALVLKLVLSRHYNIPLFSDYFDKRIMDELWLEYEFIRLSKAKETDTIKDMLQKPEEKEQLINDMFGDWIEESDLAPPDNVARDQPPSKESQIPSDGWVDEKIDFEDMEKKFMQTGNFIGEKDA